ncbi:MAG: sodium:solute symporter [Candidatus Eremiobacteraeota bacterium]|nr:sodium:solute symporter [Candidatus Eremiobacteraeota bacterium]
MNIFDWVIITVYCLGLIGFGYWMGKTQENQEDYYVGGRNLSWWSVGLSTMATQLSAISFISVPAFIALKKGGGLTWLQYEFAVPIAMIFIMITLIPFFRKQNVISVYEYLEKRFDHRARAFLSAAFLVSRGLGTGVGVYASAIVVSAVFQLDITWTILIIGVVTIIYDTMGGMKAVVYSDVIQMIILVSGVLLCIFYALEDAGGWTNAMNTLESSRLVAVDITTTGLGDESKVPFWAFLVGGFFLYSSYYGCDQSQVQRELSAPTIDDTKKSLLLNGIARFLLVLTYCIMGLLVGAVVIQNTELQALISDYGKPDYMVPIFVLEYLPHGIKALIFAAILSAAMSSLDSGLNSLSAATMRDFYERYINTNASEKQILIASKVTTAMWGVLITLFALKAGSIAPTVVEAINKVGSAFYGPILAAFLLAILTKRTNANGVIIGILAGVGINLTFWFFVPQIHWMWWNAIGCIVTFLSGYIASLAWAVPKIQKITGLTWDKDTAFGGKASGQINWIPIYFLMTGYFFLIMGIAYLMPYFLTMGHPFK